MKNVSARLALGIILSISMCASTFALEEKLADLPWDSNVSKDVRGGVRTALWKEVGKFGDEKNSSNKKYIRAYPTSYVEDLGNGRAATLMTVQRCLDEEMITEQWRYEFEKKGNDYVVADKTKVGETGGYLLSSVTNPSTAKPSKSFTFEHDLMSLEASTGKYIVSTLGKQPVGVMIEATGRFRAKPLDSYQKQFFNRVLKKDHVDSEITALSIIFHPENDAFLNLIGWDGDYGTTGSTRVKSIGGKGALVEMFNEFAGESSDQHYTPYEYSAPADSWFRDSFRIGVKTKDHGWLYYSYDPTSVREVRLVHRKKSISLRASDTGSFELISTYQAPKTRELDRAARDNRLDFRLQDPYRYDAQFDVDSDGIRSIAEVEMTVLRDTNWVEFFVFGNPKVRWVKNGNGQYLNYVPQLSYASRIYGFSETANRFRVHFPETVSAGSRVRLTVAYETLWSEGRFEGKVTDAFWRVPRFGFLPFIGALSDPAYMRFVIRTDDAYQHISIGSKLNEEFSDGYRHTEWGADHYVNFPTMIIGKYLDPVHDEHGHTKISGYMTKTFSQPGLPSPSRQAMMKEVESTKNSLMLFENLFGVKYPFADIKLIGTPSDGLGAQSPTSMVYVGEQLFWPQAVFANYAPNFDPGMNPFVTPHELGHQWWGGWVSNITDEHYWFVESFASWSSAMYEAATRKDGQYPTHLQDWHRQTMAADWIAAVKDDLTHFAPVPVQGLRYTKGPYVMHMLAQYYGRDKVNEFMRNLMVVHAGDLVSTNDIEVVAEATIGAELDWFFDQWIRGNGVPEVRYRYETRPNEQGKFVISGDLSQTIKRKGEVFEGEFFENLLVPVEVELSNGKTYRRKVIMKSATESFSFEVEAKPKKVTFNPNRAMLMEVKRM